MWLLDGDNLIYDGCWKILSPTKKGVASSHEKHVLYALRSSTWYKLINISKKVILGWVDNF